MLRMLSSIHYLHAGLRFEQSNGIDRDIQQFGDSYFGIIFRE